MQRDVLREIERLEGELSRIARELAELKRQVPGAPRRKTQAFTRPPPAPSSAPESLLGPPPPPPSSIPAPALGGGTLASRGATAADADADRWDVRPPTPSTSEVRPASQTPSSPTPTPSSPMPTPASEPRSKPTPTPTPSRRHAADAGRYEIVGEGRRRTR